MINKETFVFLRVPFIWANIFLNVLIFPDSLKQNHVFDFVTDYLWSCLLMTLSKVRQKRKKKLWISGHLFQYFQAFEILRNLKHLLVIIQAKLSEQLSKNLKLNNIFCLNFDSLKNKVKMLLRMVLFDMCLKLHIVLLSKSEMILYLEDKWT